MHHFRYDVVGLLAAVAYVAVGSAALRDADGLWDGWLLSLTAQVRDSSGECIGVEERVISGNRTACT